MTFDEWWDTLPTPSMDGWDDTAQKNVARMAWDAARDNLDHADAVRWRKHVQLMRLNLPPREVERLINAVQIQIQQDSLRPQLYQSGEKL